MNQENSNQEFNYKNTSILDSIDIDELEKALDSYYFDMRDYHLIKNRIYVLKLEERIKQLENLVNKIDGNSDIIGLK